MYPYDFVPTNKGINHKEIFVVMPFDDKYNNILAELIEPATQKASDKLNLPSELALYAHCTKDDIRMESGWVNILEHLMTAQIVLGVLTENNPNVLYELGIAHAIQPKARQILIAKRENTRIFDIKDLIYYEYDEKKLSECVEPLADRIVDTINSYQYEHDRQIILSRAKIGPSEFMVLMKYYYKRSFSLKFKDFPWEEFEKENGRGTYFFLVTGIRNLCHDGLIVLNTKTRQNKDNLIMNVEFSYYWTDLGNDVLYLMQLIDKETLERRRLELPQQFKYAKLR